MIHFGEFLVESLTVADQGRDNRWSLWQWNRAGSHTDKEEISLWHEHIVTLTYATEKRTCKSNSLSLTNPGPTPTEKENGVKL